jgi:hypothetical protein
MPGDPMEITTRQPREIRLLPSRRPMSLSVRRLYTLPRWRTPDGKSTRDAHEGTPRATMESAFVPMMEAIAGFRGIAIAASAVAEAGMIRIPTRSAGERPPAPRSVTRASRGSLPARLNGKWPTRLMWRERTPGDRRAAGRRRRQEGAGPSRRRALQWRAADTSPRARRRARRRAAPGRR